MIMYLKKTSKYMKQNLTNLKGGIDESAVVFWGLENCFVSD